ncbi:MAG: THxN family PEP-CTERM protein [Marinobacter sp.]|uniref:THxN family PEP-CTERM protein n=1 Tax=Marinobacter sp. TaxID=50741 RepID=UPI003F9671F0
MRLLAKGFFGVLFLTAAMSVAAFPVDVTSIAGIFENTQDENGNTVGGENSSFIYWGGNTSYSSYEFVSNPGVPVHKTDDTTFSLGELIHTNNQIPGSSSTLASTDLAITLGLSGFGDTGAQDGTFQFAHDETIDNGTNLECGFYLFGCWFYNDLENAPVDDTITQTGASITSSSLILGGFEYSLELIGLKDTSVVGTSEGSINNYELFAKLNATAVPVPEPGTLALLGVGLAGLTMARRRKAA